MSVDEILRTLRERGVELEASGRGLKLKYPRGALTPELREKLRENKTAVVAHLRSNPSPGKMPVDVARAWELAIRAVEMEWDALRERFGDDEAPWLDDFELQETLGEKMRRGECNAALRAIENWWNAWQDCFDAFLSVKDIAYYHLRIRAQGASAGKLTEWTEDPDTPATDRGLYELELRVRALWLFELAPRPVRRPAAQN